MEQKKRETPIIAPNRVQSAEFGRNIHLATVESGEYPEDFLKPEFWAHVAHTFNPYDHVEVRSDDGTFWGEYLVVACEKQWAKLHELRTAQLAPVGAQPTDKRFVIEYKGPHLKHCVIRASDHSIIHDGEQERAGAMVWLEGYIRTIGKKAA